MCYPEYVCVWEWTVGGEGGGGGGGGEEKSLFQGKQFFVRPCSFFGERGRKRTKNTLLKLK